MLRTCLAADFAKLYQTISRMAKAGGQKRPPIPPGGGGQSYLDWSAHIRVKKHEYEETFSIFIFLGDVPKDPEDWYSSPSFVGEHSVMVPGGGQPRRDKDTFVEGVIHLNRVIAARSGLPSFEEDVVVPYLKENIAWRVRTVCYPVLKLVILLINDITTDNRPSHRAG